MKRRHFLTTWLSLSLMLVAAGASAESIPFELELGFRWTSISGNEDMYRTQINEDDGLLLRSLTLATSSADGEMGLFDHLRLDVSDFGAGPASSLRLEAGKTEAYKLRFVYRDVDMYSALPGHANPFIDQGIIPGQHTIDRTRKMADLDLEFLPFGWITPFVGYSWYRNDGPGTTTYFAGQDEFRLDSDLEEVEKEFRLGAGFTIGRFYGQVTRGWRSYDVEESLSLAFGSVNGNNPGTILGRPVDAESLTRRSETDGSSPFTNLYVTGHLSDRVRVTANYSDLESTTDYTDDEMMSGSFISFPLLRFFSGWDQSISARSQSQIKRSGVRAEYEVMDGIDLFVGFQDRDRELGGLALINTLYLDTITFGGADPGDVETLLNAQGTLEREEDTKSLGFRTRGRWPISFWATYSETDQQVLVSQDLSEFVLPEYQSGNFDRSIKTVDAGISYAADGFVVSLAFRDEDADNPILRTDFLGRERLRVRANWTAPSNRLRIGLTAEESEQKNARADTGYLGEVSQFSGDVEYAPVDTLRLRGSWSEFRSDSQVRYRRPSTFETDTSIHLERGESWEGSVGYYENPVTFEVGYSGFENEGSNPFEILRFHSRLTYDFNDAYGIAGEYLRDDYNEAGYGLGDYQADRIGIFLRWHP